VNRRLARAIELIYTGQFDRAESLLQDLATSVSPGDDWAPTVKAVRPLMWDAAEHRRLADELDAAAQRHRVAERELCEAIEGALARGARANGSPVGSASNPPHVREPTPRQPAGASGGVRTTLRLEVRMLGAFEIAIEGRHITRWGSLKARALLQYLAFHSDRPVRRDLLMDAFWPGHTYGSARNNLNVSLYNLRRTLQNRSGSQCILYADGCYLLNPGLLWWIDRTEFLAALDRARALSRADLGQEAIAEYEQAITLYRGPLFEDDTASEWHLSEQRHLDDLYMEALERLGELRLELGDPTAARQAAQRALANDPCRESAHRLLMRCYAEEQQHHLVSRQLQICVSALRRQFGITPAPETVQVFEALTTRVTVS